MKVLLVEDDARVAGALATALRRRGYEVLHVSTAADALAAPACDLVLLDLGLPDQDGLEVCRALRDRGGVGIIALTARGDERDRVIGLRSGADDYVVKPFSLAELQARMDAVLRRARPSPGGVLQAGPLRLDLDSHQVTCHGNPVSLTRKEFDLLASLAREPGAVIPRDRLFLEVWHTAWRGAGRTLDVHMATLRAKLGDPALIETVRGVGYRLAAPAGSAPYPPPPDAGADPVPEGWPELM